jgi:hypothetical protein
MFISVSVYSSTYTLLIELILKSVIDISWNESIYQINLSSDIVLIQLYYVEKFF